MFLMWLGEQITSRGIGNGSSLIIFAGIISAVPGRRSSRRWRLGPQRHDLDRRWSWPWFGILALAVVAFIVFMERAQRRVLITYPKRQVRAIACLRGPDLVPAA